MKRSMTMLMVIAMMISLLAAPASAAKKKRRSEDPWKGRVAVGLRLGGAFGGGSAFVGQLSLTYWWVKYVSTTIASGYGFYTAEYIDAQNEVQTTTVNYVPSEFLLTLYPIPGGQISPYLGPERRRR
ncbi:MAG: hypothetical protein M5R36_07865 [Deltaproteobacteria bacterium]|nr:hypothetical protein [Deltaproteobacteria bacterium]